MCWRKQSMGAYFHFLFCSEHRQWKEQHLFSTIWNAGVSKIMHFIPAKTKLRVFIPSYKIKKIKQRLSHRHWIMSVACPDIKMSDCFVMFICMGKRVLHYKIIHLLRNKDLCHIIYKQRKSRVNPLNITPGTRAHKTRTLQYCWPF